MNIPRVLDTIKSTDDLKIQVNILTGLSALLPFKLTRDEVMTSRVIYTTAHSILSQGVGDHTVRVLGFLTALLRVARSDAACAAATCARELLRCSGCLWDMTSMFLDTMMAYGETWKTLCECLIESCNDYEDNQNYCSHLIPTCILRCHVRSNSEILKLLHSLLMNNTRNIHIFVKCNGLSIFTRETIRDILTMELLATVVQNSEAANLLKRNTELLKSLFIVKDMVEWASVILFHITSHIEPLNARSIQGVDKIADSAEIELNKMDTDNTTENTVTSSSDLTVSFLFGSNIVKCEPNMLNNMNTGNGAIENNLESSIIKITNLKASSEGQFSFHSSTIDFLTENNFTPNRASTPKRPFKTANERKFAELHKVHKSIAVHKNNKAYFKRQSHGNNSAPVVNQKLSASTRLFKFINNCCVSIYKTVGKIFFNSAAYDRPGKDPKNGSTLSGEAPLKRILCVNQKYRKNIVKKLKFGIHIYGCNFKKISQTMWSEEKQMTPQMLYSIYRKYIVK